MIHFDVNDMSCGHCVASITQAVKTVDPAADVQVDLANHRVAIASSAAAAGRLGAAIAAAGFTPVAVPRGAGAAGTAG